MFAKPALSLVAGLALAACAGSSAVSPGPSLPSSSAPSPTATATAGPTLSIPTASPAATQPAPTKAAPTIYTSPIYGYSLTLPAGFAVGAAMFRWDGTSAIGHDDPEVDKFASTTSVSFFAYGAPVSLDLAGLVKERIAANARDHGDTCPAAPEVNEKITVAGQPGVFLAYNCGILINIVITERDGWEFDMVARDLDVKAATNPADRAVLDALLKSFVFPM